jgi:hypothetical protein
VLTDYVDMTNTTGMAADDAASRAELPAGKHAAAEQVGAHTPSSEYLADIDDEEKARVIADEDLQGPRKQVRYTSVLLPPLCFL